MKQNERFLGERLISRGITLPDFASQPDPPPGDR